MDDYKAVQQALESGMMRKTAIGDIEIYCYTQDCFFGKDTWNDLTRTHRGALYVEGQRVNRAFDKIFNLNEVPETEIDLVQERMNNERYSIYHKSNGHLFIVSVFEHPSTKKTKIVYHTKGGLPHEGNDLLNDDIVLFEKNHSQWMNVLASQHPNSTWMFEAIVDHDKHTLYDQEIERFGENQFVLLGANIKNEVGDWKELPYVNLAGAATYLDCPLITRIKFDTDEHDLNQWFDHKNTEGYVIHFLSDGQRVKIKTKDYWAMRFKKDLSTDRILEMVASKGDSKLITKLPEEVAEQILEVLYDSIEYWYLDELIKPKTLDKWIPVDRKQVALSDELTKEQKSYLFNLSSIDKTYPDVVLSSKNLRKNYVAGVLSKNEDSNFSRNEYYHLDEKLKRVVDKIGEE